MSDAIDLDAIREQLDENGDPVDSGSANAPYNPDIWTLCGRLDRTTKIVGALLAERQKIRELHSPAHGGWGTANGESGAVTRDGVGAPDHTWCKAGCGGWPCETSTILDGTTSAAADGGEAR